MALGMGGARRRNRGGFDIWPGFVDALATLLIIIIFVLMVFVLAQFFLGQALTGRDEALQRMTDQLAEMTELLALERSTISSLKLELSQANAQVLSANAQIEALGGRVRAGRETEILVNRLEANLSAAEERAARLSQDVAALEALKAELEAEIARQGAQLNEADGQLREERRLSEEARAQTALLAQQLQALRAEMARLNEILEATEAENAEKDIQIANLGQRLNAALATKVQELRRYRSEFFGRMREILGERDDIRIEGDRFVFQSEVLFPSGSAQLQAGGQDSLSTLANTLLELSTTFPDDIDWILRVDGHTDIRPIRTASFQSNWDLSAARAISVVEYLIAQGIPPERLAAAGFGEHQPLVDGETEADFARNRRIEVKFDQR